MVRRSRNSCGIIEVGIGIQVGLAPGLRARLEQDGVQVMNPIPGLASLLSRAKENGVFGTKMRSFIQRANPVGIKQVVDQQFEIAQEIVAAQRRERPPRLAV